jgi:hypothetical protein
MGTHGLGGPCYGWGRTASEGHATDGDARPRRAMLRMGTHGLGGPCYGWGRTASEGHATAVISQLCLGRWQSP